MSQACRESLRLLFGTSVYNKSKLSYPIVKIHEKNKKTQSKKITKFLFVGTQFELKGGKALLKAFSNAYKKNPNISLNIITHLPHNYSQDYNGTCDDAILAYIRLEDGLDGKSTIEPDLVGKFAGVTGSIIVDGLKGEVTARCGDTVANDVTLNFVLDCINGKAEPSKEEYGNRILSMKKNVSEDLRKWFKQKWVNIGKKDKDGKHPPCGTSGKKRGYAKCVPASKARGMSKKEKESATRRKRAAQNKAGRGGTSNLKGGGKKPIRVSTKPKK